MRIICFPWYELPEIRQAHGLFWSILANHLGRYGLREVPDSLSRDLPVPGIFTDPRLLLSQCCGYDVIYGFASSLSIVATPSYSAPGCNRGTYSSCVLVRDDAQVSELNELRGTVCVVNSFNSHSGTNALRALVAPLSLGGRFFSAVKVSGGHQKSLALLRAREADVMAMDSVLYGLLQQHRPDALSGTRILQWSEPAPAPPFITSATTDRDDLDKLRAALCDTLSDEASRDVRAALLLEGINVVPLEEYAKIIEFEATALRYGYLELHASSPVATIWREDGWRTK
jgi:ABC-type phosphate/phosphonate transport system substrate-binding protein